MTRKTKKSPKRREILESTEIIEVQDEQEAKSPTTVEETLKSELAQTNDRLLRLAAEFENFQKFLPVSVFRVLSLRTRGL